MISRRADLRSVKRTLLKALAAGLAVQARVSEPLDADTIAELDGGILGVCADGYNDTDALCAEMSCQFCAKTLGRVPRVHPRAGSLPVRANRPGQRGDRCGRHR